MFPSSFNLRHLYIANIKDESKSEGVIAWVGIVLVSYSPDVAANLVSHAVSVLAFFAQPLLQIGNLLLQMLYSRVFAP